MNKELLQTIMQDLEYLPTAGKVNHAGVFADHCFSLVAAVEELQAENERLEELEEPLVRWCNGYVDEISRLKAEIDMLTKGAL